MNDDPIPALTPAALYEAMSARLSAYDKNVGRPVVVRGIPIKRRSSEREYSGYIYAEIRDPYTEDKLDARFPVKIAQVVEWNREAVFVGLLCLKARWGNIAPEFRVDDIQQVRESTRPSKDELFDRWSDAIRRPKRDLALAMAGEKPRVLIITGTTSVAVDDVRSQLREAEAGLEIRVRRVPMNNIAELVTAVRSGTDADFVVLTRGGGGDVHDLDEDTLIGAVASSPVPVAVALGHATDDLALGRVADAAFPTPTAFGDWLRTQVNLKRIEQQRRRDTEAETARRKAAEAEATRLKEAEEKAVQQTKAVLAQLLTLKQAESEAATERAKAEAERAMAEAEATAKRARAEAEAIAKREKADAEAMARYNQVLAEMRQLQAAEAQAARRREEAEAEAARRAKGEARVAREAEELRSQLEALKAMQARFRIWRVAAMVLAALLVIVLLLLVG